MSPPPPPAPEYSPAEWEAIGLCIAVEAIDDIVNHALLDVYDECDSGGVNVGFPTTEHRALFLIRAVDFVSDSKNPMLSGLNGSCLGTLSQACQQCALGTTDGAARLDATVRELKAWIDEPVPLALYVPTFGRDVTLNVSRRELVRLSGNQAKHNLSRLTGVAGALRGALIEAGATVSLLEVLLALDDFKEPLGEGYLVYHATRLVELLNEVRWGVHVYLRPAFEKAQERHDEAGLVRVTYRMPPGVDHEIPQRWFWRLMNHVRRKPVVPRFRTPECLLARP